MRMENGRLLRTWKAGHPAKYNAYLEDYAYLADGLLALYQTTFDTQWFAWAQELAEMMVAQFLDTVEGGFFDTSADHEELLHRPKDIQDNATPSANAMAAKVLLQLSLYTGNGRYWDIAAQSTASLQDAMSRYPTGFAHWLCNAAFMLSMPQEVAIVGQRGADDTEALREVVFAAYRPDIVVALGDADDGNDVPLLRERPLRNNQATAYVCRRFVCQHPVTTPHELQAQLNGEPDIELSTDSTKKIRIIIRIFCTRLVYDDSKARRPLSSDPCFVVHECFYFHDVSPDTRIGL